MENDLMARPKPPRRTVWVTVAIIAFIGMIAAIVYAERVTIKNFFTGENQEEVQIENDSTYEDPMCVLTIQEILDMREDIRETKRIDSVFLAIPQVVLIDILMNHGTSLSIKDIVYIYESNTSTYNNVLSGARAQKYLDDSIQKDVSIKIEKLTNDSVDNK